jgi:hypothetical protein
MKGIRCEVASTKETMAEDLLGAANGFIDLGKIIVAQSQETNIDASPADGIAPTPDLDHSLDIERELS